MLGGTSSIGTRWPEDSTRRSKTPTSPIDKARAIHRIALVISIAHDFFPRVSALDVLEEELAGRWRAHELVVDGLGNGEIPVDPGRLKLDFERFGRRVIADTGDVAGIDGLALGFAHGVNLPGNPRVLSTPLYAMAETITRLMGWPRP